MYARTLLLCLVSFFLLFPGIVAAGENYPEIIEFEGVADGGGSEDIYPSTYTGPITFLHQKHIKEYATGCGDCHHDGDHEPIIAYTEDESFSCIDCHDSEGMIRGAIAENAATIDDFIMYRANVLHMKCIGCHKKFNTTVHVVMAPEACRFCHTKRPRDWVVK